MTLLSEAEAEITRTIVGIKEAAANSHDPLMVQFILSLALGEAECALVSIRGARETRAVRMLVNDSEWDGVEIRP